MIVWRANGVGKKSIYSEGTILEEKKLGSLMDGIINHGIGKALLNNDLFISY